MQIVGYETGEGAPALRVAARGGLEELPLAPGAELSYSLSERHCAGRVEGDGHEPCPRESAPYCERHADRWACARCRGDCDRPLPSCREEHAVYLAAFAPATFKVGVTRSWRLRTRLREQGADRAAHVRTVADGATARRIEADIAREVGDRVPVSAKLRGLHLPIDSGAWERLLSDFDVLETFAFEYGLDLSERPVPETLLTGTVRGTQGRLLVLEHGDCVYAVDMRDLLGHELESGPTDRQLQSTLGAFG